MTQMANDVAKKFNDIFHEDPQLFFSPGRINLIGEHVDYNNGFVMPGAVDQGVWYAVTANNSNNIHVHSADLNEELQLSLNDVHKIKGWKNYILGVVDQLQKRNSRIGGFNAVFGGNLSIGAGMSSSAAVECGLAVALNEVFQLNISRVDIAIICQKAEHTFPGVMCGIMDQFANMMGVKDHVLLLDCDSLQYEKLPFDMKDYAIVLINSKVHHELAGGEYNKRRSQCEEGLQILKSQYPSVNNFRDVKSEYVEEQKKFLGEEVYMRCLYVTQEIERTQQAAQFLRKGDMESFGKLMFQTHEGLSKLYNVSCPELDFLVQEAKHFPEIIGSRLMGGGFGGCTINIVLKNDAEKISEQVMERYKKEFNIQSEMYRVNLTDGTHRISE
jgi:galactokinase